VAKQLDFKPPDWNLNSVILQINKKEDINEIVTHDRIIDRTMTFIDRTKSIIIHGCNDFEIVANDFEIIDNESAREHKYRFALAHELGHYFLHSNQGEKPLIAIRFDSGRLEWEANWFAAGLLIPGDICREKYAGKKYNDNIREIADFFNVSPVLAIIRTNLLEYY